MKVLLEGLAGQLLSLRSGGNSRLRLVSGIDLTANLQRRFAYSHALIRPEKEKFFFLYLSRRSPPLLDLGKQQQIT